ncbi:Pectin lyase-like superfamily protein [Arabidopsis thaliana]|uniref:Pectin lyase-like superfamily protein n=1 Tax=Arabidopsis thaliana TaxID=3702 RepID=A0A1I9LQU2_ARATH|nr:Pectin lyase-like superfamily protein [Arabidopsis thaliana]ANM64950.1 Pectin lyase-like superfamily protein [Arabidopsis thaliana]|eukprot:NP_001326950.1 Pectin lyase-like superfamily protein [Arabidopsis thaliana]
MGNLHGIHRSHHGGSNFPGEAPNSPFPPPYTAAPAPAPAPSSPSDHHMTVGPYCHVDSSLRSLAGKAEGFGRAAVGGLNGPICHVTSLADEGPGSLREACKRPEPLWIVFDVSGTINLSSFVNVSSHTTVDGRGQKVKITGKGLRLKECENVIICNLEFEGGVGPDADAIQIKPKSHNIWIDRCSLKNYYDGLIDITRESTDITVSRCHFMNHNKTMLIGADTSHVTDRCIRVTIHHCFFDGTRQRHPRVRFAKVHLFNNYTRHWAIYAVGAGVESQCNIYEAGEKKTVFKYITEKAADKEKPGAGFVRSEGDLLLNGAKSCLSQGGERYVFSPIQHYSEWTVESPTDILKNYLKHSTGWQNLPLPLDRPPTTA